MLKGQLDNSKRTTHPSVIALVHENADGETPRVITLKQITSIVKGSMKLSMNDTHKDEGVTYAISVPASLILDKRVLEPLMSNHDESSPYPERKRETISKLIAMDRMQGRYHSPHRLSIGFINSKLETPNEQRFNKYLSPLKHINSPLISGYSPRKNYLVQKPNCTSTCYDVNYDAVRENPMKPVPDLSRLTAHKDSI